MIQTVVFKQSISVATVAVLQAAVPPAIVGGCLYLVAYLYGVPFSNSYVYMAVLAAVLAIALLRSSNGAPGHVLIRDVPLAVGVLWRWLALLALLLAVGYATKFSAEFSRRVVLSWMLVTPALLILGAVLLRELMRALLLHPDSARSVIFAGCNEASLSLSDRIGRHSELSMRVAGFFDDRGPDRLGLQHDVRLLGKLPDVAAYVRRHRIDVIFIALPLRHIRRVMDLMDELRDTTASIYYVPDIFVFDLIQARTGEIMGIPVVSLCETPFYGVRGVTKRLTDIVISSLILVPLAPLFALIAIAVKWSSPGPVIFKQRRYGLDGREIGIYKFRSMTVTEDGAHVPQATREDSRLTRVGRFLRRYSLDELPQLINVLQGRMSLVGPRPHAVAHNEQYRKLIKGYMLRHKVLPGITGLAQVNGCRGETSRLEEMQARVNYDLEYLRNWSPMLDIKILMLTALRLLRDERAY
jgi:putative colanic acid biosysnthesis UDP-glucose lipid carrier transferase